MADATDRRDPPHWLDPPLWWRKFKPLRWIVLAVAAIWAVGFFDLTRFVKLPEKAIPSFLRPDPHPEAAQYTRVAVGVPLIDPFRSYEDLQSVTATLSAAGFGQWEATSRRAVESSSYPPYRFDTVKVARYRNMDSTGSLSLRFFNNRLYQAEFVPDKPEDYARRLRALDLSRDANARAEKIDGNLRVASTVGLAISPVGMQLGTEPFVIWQDLRLIRQRDQWDEEFGAIPKQVIGD